MAKLVRKWRRSITIPVVAPSRAGAIATATALTDSSRQTPTLTAKSQAWFSSVATTPEWQLPPTIGMAKRFHNAGITTQQQADRNVTGKAITTFPQATWMATALMKLLKEVAPLTTMENSCTAQARATAMPCT